MGAAVGGLASLAAPALSSIAGDAMGAASGLLGKLGPQSIMHLVTGSGSPISKMVGPLMGMVGKGLHSILGAVPGASLGPVASVGKNLFGAIDQILGHQQTTSGASSMIGAAPGAASLLQSLAGTNGVQVKQLIPLLVKQLMDSETVQNASAPVQAGLGALTQSFMPSTQAPAQAAPSSELNMLEQALSTQAQASGSVINAPAGSTTAVGTFDPDLPTPVEVEYSQLAFALRFLGAVASERINGKLKADSPYVSIYAVRTTAQSNLNSRLGVNLMWDVYTMDTPTKQHLSALREAFYPSKDGLATKGEITFYIGEYKSDGTFDCRPITVAPFRQRVAQTSYDNQVWYDGSYVCTRGDALGTGSYPLERYVRSAVIDLKRETSLQTVSHACAALALVISMFDVSPSGTPHVYTLVSSERDKTETCMFELEDATASRLTEDTQAKQFFAKNIAVSEQVISNAKSADAVTRAHVAEKRRR